MNNKVIVISDSILDEYALSKETHDTYIQVQNVCKVLSELNYEPIKVKFDFNIQKLADRILKIEPVFIFNLVEAEDKIVLAPLIFENLNIPFTGAGSFTISSTNNKLIMKQTIFNSKFQIKTPSYYYENSKDLFKKDSKYILKAIGFHASVNIDDSFVVSPANGADLKNKLIEFRKKFKMHYFAEEYIDGREFNVAILNKKILPVQEIVFKDYPEGKNKIMCFKSKWEEDSFEYKNTTRNYSYAEEDKQIVRNLINTSKECIELFNLDSYARIDYRADNDGIPYVIDINANPCISPDAGFTAACSEINLNYKDMIKEIITPVLNKTKE